MNATLTENAVWNKEFFWPLLLFTLSFLLYANTIFHGYVLDDEIVILNKYVQEGFDGIANLLTSGYAYGYNGVNEGAYRPLTLVVFAVEIGIFGNNVVAHHLINILVYSGTCVLLFAVLKRLLHGHHKYLAASITLLFIIHPVHTEVVANIKSRDEILTLLFLLLCLFAIIRFQETGKVWRLALSAFWFFLALLCKENAITFIAIIPLTIYFFFKETARKSLLIILPFICMTVIYLLLREKFLSATSSAVTSDVINNSLAEAKNLSQRYATIFYILGKYLVILMFPYKLSFDYSYKEVVVVTWANYKAVVSFMVAAFLVMYALWNSRSRSVFSYGILFFFITLSVVMNVFIDIGATMAERFLFLPSLGFCMALGMIILKISKMKPAGKPTLVFFSAISIIMVLSSYKTINRNRDWKSNLTLFTADVKTSPLSARAHYNLGNSLKNEADSLKGNESKKRAIYQEAIKEYQSTITIYSKYTEAYVKISEICAKQGLVAGQAGRLDDAMYLLQQAIAYDSSNFSAYSNLGVAWLQKNNPDSALHFFRRSLEIRDNPDARMNLGVALGNKGVEYHTKGEMRHAISYYRRALNTNPNQLNVYNNLGMAYEIIGDLDSANYFKEKLASLASQ